MQESFALENFEGDANYVLRLTRRVGKFLPILLQGGGHDS